jgi:hypothetical protein
MYSPSTQTVLVNRSMLRLQIIDDVVRLVGKIPRKKVGLHLLLADRRFLEQLWEWDRERVIKLRSSFL